MRVKCGKKGKRRETESGTRRTRAVMVAIIASFTLFGGYVMDILIDMGSNEGLATCWEGALDQSLSPHIVRFATFNTGDLRTKDLWDTTGLAPRVKEIAQIIQRVDPDVLSLNEIAFDVATAKGSARAFVEDYLRVPQADGLQGIDYPYIFFVPVNTGVPSGMDLNNDGVVGGPNDCFGFGNFEGQYGMALLSKYPIDMVNARTFQHFLWRDMPNGMIPPGYYTDDELELFPLSSKSHWDVPIEIDGETVHVLMAHPTPPVFDGPEDRNGRRNHDEIRFLADYIAGADFIYDDDGMSGGLPSGSKFVIMGDMNADPSDGDSTADAILQLVENPLINTSFFPAGQGGIDNANPLHKNPPGYDTCDWNDPNPGNIQADYVLPSWNMVMVSSGVFWPSNSDPLSPIVTGASDHRLVWVNIGLTP